MPERELRDRLGEALHRHSYYKDHKSWVPSGDPARAHFELSESAREDWRTMADRFLSEIAPACGVEVK